MSEFEGRQQDNLGWQESQDYVDDPDNSKVPDRSRNEHTIGMQSFQQAKLRDILDDVSTLFASTSSNAAAAAAAQAAADTAQAAADAAALSAGSAGGAAAAAQAAADAAQTSADSAQTSADNAQTTADAAQVAAAAAQAGADAAQTAADNAQTAADNAQSQVVVAQAAADDAAQNALDAKFGYTTVADIPARDALTPSTGDIVSVTDASGDPTYAPQPVSALYEWNGTSWDDITDTYVIQLAQQVADNAELIGTNAENIAVNATNIANVAQAAADAAQATADTAQATADVASLTASTAQSAAATAQATAATAQSTADTAQATADTAQFTADTAQSAADAAQATADATNALVGVINGIATLDGSGKVPASQLPSYVDDVLEFNTFGDLPATGESGKLYVLSDNTVYRWSGSSYFQVSGAGGGAGAGVFDWRLSIVHDGLSNNISFGANEYVIGSGRLVVYADGVLLTSGTHYTEATISSITMIGDLANVAANLDVYAFAENTVGAANGVAPLDATGKVPLANLPDGLAGGLNYVGTWNASTNTPTITGGSGNAGDYYRVSVAGSTNIDGETDWEVGDWIIFNGTAWDKLDQTESVTAADLALKYDKTGGAVTGPILLPDGSSGAPGLAFSSASNLGIYYSSLNGGQMRLVAGGGSSMEIRSNLVKLYEPLELDSGGAAVTQFDDDETFAADSATRVATQRATKALVTTETAGVSKFGWTVGGTINVFGGDLTKLQYANGEIIALITGYDIANHPPFGETIIAKSSNGGTTWSYNISNRIDGFAFDIFFDEYTKRYVLPVLENDFDWRYFIGTSASGAFTPGNTSNSAMDVTVQTRTTLGSSDRAANQASQLTSFGASGSGPTYQNLTVLAMDTDSPDNANPINSVGLLGGSNYNCNGAIAQPKDHKVMSIIRNGSNMYIFQMDGFLGTFSTQILPADILGSGQSWSATSSGIMYDVEKDEIVIVGGAVTDGGAPINFRAKGADAGVGDFYESFENIPNPNTILYGGGRYISPSSSGFSLDKMDQDAPPFSYVVGVYDPINRQFVIGSVAGGIQIGK